MVFGFLPNLAQALDKPGFNWKALVLGFSAAHFVFESYLGYRQYRVLQRTKPPTTLEGIVDDETFNKTQTYGRAKARFGLISSIYSFLTDTAMIAFDILPLFWDLAGKAMATAVPAGFAGPISQSVLFFLGYNFVSTIISLPVSLYSTFVLEQKFGFNKQTPKLFFTDLIKSQILIALIGSPVIATFLKIVNYFGKNFFYYLWLFAFVFQLFMVTVYPILIEPLFNEVTPMADGEVKQAVEKLSAELSFPLQEVYQIDGSKRSAHSNAYFYGLPWKKRIVIYDTLLSEFTPQETVAVLAHELGHWSLSHTTRIMAVGQLHLFALFLTFSIFLGNKSLYTSFGFKTPSILIGFLLFNEILSPLNSVLQFGMSVLSRKYEYEADAFAVNLKYRDDLANSLIKLHIQNLSTMDADWLYSSYHYSHPILPERLRAIGWKAEKKSE
ncbi:peptidase family M48-domain-containing protein [Lipomyces oligophaga]|uniref:peptidase family M48-domain-containing protein n=1 Tax=Lipomyces oligophaga TaxID=45792 RepID=UPI0034CEA004